MTVMNEIRAKAGNLVRTLKAFAAEVRWRALPVEERCRRIRAMAREVIAEADARDAARRANAGTGTVA